MTGPTITIKASGTGSHPCAVPGVQTRREAVGGTAARWRVIRERISLVGPGGAGGDECPLGVAKARPPMEALPHRALPFADDRSRRTQWSRITSTARPRPTDRTFSGTHLRGGPDMHACLSRPARSCGHDRVVRETVVLPGNDFGRAVVMAAATQEAPTQRCGSVALLEGWVLGVHEGDASRSALRDRGEHGRRADRLRGRWSWRRRRAGVWVRLGGGPRRDSIPGRT
ncbi:hypothetical protein QF035_010190 [Streptomyces umbrinus]|uniref:Uncharacterized protein n=1 Tax=Streptomyces umbrinus TaxID=67370 RepID=A0ABU0T9W5_9ACTN|nr:hypothetical protein [Streptomyces umbrinus]